MTDDQAGEAIVLEPNDLRIDLDDAALKDELDQVAHRYGIPVTEMATRCCC